MTRKATLLAAGSATLIAAAQPAMADEAPLELAMATTVSDLRVIGRRDNAQYAPERVGTATKTDTPLIELPQSVSVITEAVIDDLSMQSMADVVRYVPGVVMGQGEGHRDAPTIRGNETTADFFVDGVRDDVQYFRDLYNVERVEVLKGPNALIFGRGGGGGVINRVTKSARWEPLAEISAELGAYDHARAAVDLNAPLGATAAGRFNAFYQDSESYRDFVDVRRYGLAPTITLAPHDQLTARLSYERYDDERVVDRGVPSFQNRPARTDRSTFFGSPDVSFATANVDAMTATVQFRFGRGLTLRNHTSFADYDKFYQNVLPGAVSGQLAEVSLSAYNNRTARENLINQTDLVWDFAAGGMDHTLLAGAELSRQETDNFRMTGYFNGSATSIRAPFASPTLFNPPVEFRQSASDADNHVETTVAAVYLQDQIALTDQLKLLAGLRFDSFKIEVRENRTGHVLSRRDEVVSPRLGLVYQPMERLSLYASFSRSFLPSSGDQFASLTPSSQALGPEEFQNIELGAKWAPRPDLLVTAAVYELERANTTARHPTDPTRIVQTGERRTRGFELEVAGRLTQRWEVLGGYSWMEAEITSDTTGAPAGRRVPLTPEHTFSLWNKYAVTPQWAVGLGVIHQDDMFASISNTTVLPSFTRLDAAVFYDVTEKLRVQLNVENLTNETYWPTAHNDNNITPGAPRSARVTLTARF